jgi:four helix bundle protein
VTDDSWRMTGRRRQQEGKEVILMKPLMMTNYKTLEAWKKSMQLVKNVYALVRSFPKEELYGLTSQLKRAVVSIPANIAEGTGRQYKKDTIHFLHIARGSLYEVETLVDIALMVGVMNEDQLNLIAPLVDETQKILNGFINHLERASLK